MGEFSKFFGLTFSALLPLVNPLGDALVFLSLVGSAPPDVYRTLARRIAISTTIFLITMEAVGTLMLRFFGISLPVVQVSGGLALAAMGWKLLNQEEPDPKMKPPEVDGSAGLPSLEQKVFYPFTFPITAGPGCIVVMVTLSAHAAVKGMFPAVAAHAGIVIAVVLLSVAVYFCYGHAPKITARISPQTAHGILRLIAFVLLCIGVQITSNGVEAIVKGADSLTKIKVERISIERDGINFTEPALPKDGDNWLVPAKQTRPVGWRPQTNPGDSLVRLFTEKGIQFSTWVNVVLRVSVGTERHDYQQKLAVRVFATNGDVKQIAG